MRTPIKYTDGYKLDHRRQYPEGTTFVYSNWTPRKSRIDGVDKVVFFGLQYFIKKYLIEDFNENFFNKDIEEVVSDYSRRVNNYLGENEVGEEHIRELHKLGYLPIFIMALPEGSHVNIRVPMFTMQNTHPDFFWLVNYFETLVSCTVWQPCTSATIAHQYSKLFNGWAKLSTDMTDSNQFHLSVQGHDFSMRGMSGVESAAMSGAGHLLSFVGTDTLPAIDFLEEYYGADSDKEMIGISVPATEHSVMCAGQKDDEFETFKRLITEVYPTGIVSIVSDTWDLWKVLTDYLPRLKDEILARDGKVVIRPDSGDPVDILCGYLNEQTENYFEDNGVVISPDTKGVVELLWDVFGGTVNSKGYKELDPHIGCIYGDSITLERADQICSRLARKGFASTNWVAGIGSYTYQYNTRDTFGFAMKATYVKVDGIGRSIFKDPITDDGTKKSAKGLMKVIGSNGKYQLVDELERLSDVFFGNEMDVVFENGKLMKAQTLSEIRERINN